MDLRSFLAVAIVAVVAGPGSASDDSYGEGNARARLVVSADWVDSAEPVLIGVEFDIRPGWHIYWKNPGGAGLATDIRWRLPDGVEADLLRWPLPVGFTQSGDIPGYGYEDSVVLAARFRSAAPVPGDAVVGVSVSWLACKDVCVLGSAELEEPLARIAIDPGLADWEEALPRASAGPDPPFTVTVKKRPHEGTIGLWLQWRAAPQLVEWFPDPPDGLEVESVTIQTRGGLTRIDAVVRELAGSTAGHEYLDSVVVATDEQNRRRGWNLAVDLENLQGKGDER